MEKLHLELMNMWTTFVPRDLENALYIKQTTRLGGYKKKSYGMQAQKEFVWLEASPKIVVIEV